jgi:PKD repeat protein
MRKAITIVFSFFTLFGYSQKEANVWCFGDKTKIDFNFKPEKVSPQFATSMFARYGCANICNSKGRLLLYTNGGSIWDSTNSQFKTGLNGDYIYASQSALIVPQPDSSSNYFIFTPASVAVDFVYYSKFDFRLNSGKGEISPNVSNVKIPTKSTGKITAVRHSNRHDYWVVTANHGTDEIHSYFVNNKGVSSSPVVSNTGLKIVAKPYDSLLGYMKISPDGKKLCYVCSKDSGIIADFNSETGKLSNVWKVRINIIVGIEFSPKSQFLYTVDFRNTYRLVQFDITKRTKSEFLASRKTIDSGTISTQETGMQLASNGKIYISPYNAVNTNMHVIHNPDSIGKYAKFQKNYIDLTPILCNIGLPDFIQSYFHKKHFNVSQNCRRDTAFFEIADKFELDSAHWDFGDASSGINNKSTKTSGVFHCFKKPGRYAVTLFTFHKLFNDTIRDTIVVNYGKPNLGNDTVVCKGESIAIAPKGGIYTGYRWNNGQIADKIFAGVGTSILKVTDYDGCVNADTIVISEVVISPLIKVIDSNLCFKGNYITLKDATKYKGVKRLAARWYIDNSTTITDSMVHVTFTNTGQHIIKLVIKNTAGCIDSVEKQITIWPSPKAAFSINDTIQCLNQNKFSFINQSTITTGTLQFDWDLSQYSNTKVDNQDVVFIKTGKQIIRLIATSNQNCSDTVAKSITIQPSPTADFSWNASCELSPVQFTFTGTKPNKTYNWELEKAVTDTNQNPKHQFSGYGNKRVRLTVTNTDGCKDSISKMVEIKPQAKAEFKVSDGCEKDSLSIENQSIGATQYKWKFGDGNTSTLANPKHVYTITKPTTFNITLVAVVNGGCSDSITKAVTINTLPSSDFGFTQNQSKIEFKATQSGLEQYRWKFGNGDSGQTNKADYSYDFKKNNGLYNVCLTTINLAGCKSTTCKQIQYADTKTLSSQNAKLYPNPNTGTFTLEINQLPATCEVINNIGQILYQTSLTQAATKLDLEIAKGIYWLRIGNSNGVVNYRLVIVGKE